MKKKDAEQRERILEAIDCAYNHARAVLSDNNRATIVNREAIYIKCDLTLMIELCKAHAAALHNHRDPYLVGLLHRCLMATAQLSKQVVSRRAKEHTQEAIFEINQAINCCDKLASQYSKNLHTITKALAIEPKATSMEPQIEMSEKGLLSSRKVNADRPPPVLKLLEGFAWFCSPPNREHIVFITTNLNRDVEEMRAEHHKEFFVHCVLLWQVVARTMLPIIWDGSLRFLGSLMPLSSFISKIKGF